MVVLLKKERDAVAGLVSLECKVLIMDTPFHIRSFYKELIALYKKYDFSIAHEDSHGSFIIENYNENNVDWIMDADIKANVPKLPDELSWLDKE